MWLRAVAFTAIILLILAVVCSKAFADVVASPQEPSIGQGMPVYLDTVIATDVPISPAYQMSYHPP